MRRMQIERWRSFAILALLLIFGTGIAGAQEAAAPAIPREPAAQLKLMISAYADGAPIPTPFSCAAQRDERGDLHSHLNPALKWTDAPKGTASFAIIFHDIEGTGNPRNGYIDSMHWLVWNIPANSTQISENLPIMPELPDGTRQGTNIARRIGYQGACGGASAPGAKPHHFVMMLYALDQMLDLKGGASAADLIKAMDLHILGKSAYVGLEQSPGN